MQNPDQTGPEFEALARAGDIEQWKQSIADLHDNVEHLEGEVHKQYIEISRLDRTLVAVQNALKTTQETVRRRDPRLEIHVEERYWHRKDDRYCWVRNIYKDGDRRIIVFQWESAEHGEARLMQDLDFQLSFVESD